MDAALDLIESSFLYIDRIARDFSDFDRESRGIEMTAAAAIDELNERFRRAGVRHLRPAPRIPQPPAWCWREGALRWRLQGASQPAQFQAFSPDEGGIVTGSRIANCD